MSRNFITIGSHSRRPQVASFDTTDICNRWLIWQIRLKLKKNDTLDGEDFVTKNSKKCRTCLHHVTCSKSSLHHSQCFSDTTMGSKNSYPTHWCQDVNHISTSAREITVITIWVVFLAASLMVTYWVVWFGCGEFITIYWPCIGKSSSGGGGMFDDEIHALVVDNF